MVLSALLAAKGLVALATGVLYVYVARLVLQRDAPVDARRAHAAFATWWWTFGVLEFLAGAYSIPAAMGHRDLALVTTLINVMLVLIAAALAGLVYFLLYLYTGWRRAFWPVVAAYALLALALMYLVAWMQPIGFDEASSDARIVFARELTGLPAVLLGLLLSLPVLVAAIGHGSLYFGTRVPELRFRIAVISLAFVGWFGWSTVSAALQLAQRHPDSLALFAVNSAISLIVPLLVILAYRPFGWIRARLDGAGPA